VIVLFLFAWVAAEIAVLIEIGSSIGVLNTLGLLLVSTVVGVWVAKQQGLSLFRRAQTDWAARRMPPGTALEGLLLLLAGVLFIVPGFISDVVGLALLASPVRKFVARRLQRRWFRAGWSGSTTIDLE
jgi:UPF0716 protein FxsA